MTNEQRWYLRRRVPQDYIQRMQAQTLDPILAKVLYARKIETPDTIASFISGTSALDDPLRLADMSRAVERIRLALTREEPIVVYGDFDADGVCATTLLVLALQHAGAQVTAYIPDRFSEAYGLNIPALEQLAQQGTRLVITVDCGIRSVKEVARAQELGLDMIITDHHSVPRELPPALAIINPKRPESDYAFRELAGVGVAYRLVTALYAALQPEQTPPVESFLDLVAVGTVADIVPLVDENRTLVRQGLQRLRRSPRPGLAALMQVSDVTPEYCSSTDIGFRLGPRINAAGRLESALWAYELLSASDAAQATELAHRLDQVNSKRKLLLEEQVARAQYALNGHLESDKVLIVADPDFHEGIVGLVASRLVNEYYRPAIVMRRGPVESRGSARSIPGFHVTKALESCEELFDRFGGHAQAAGFTLPSSNLEAFRQALQEHALERINDDMLKPRHEVDAIIALDELDDKTPEHLDMLEPCGEGNPDPMLATLGLTVQDRRAVGSEGRHLKLTLNDGQRRMPCIAFRLGHLANELPIGSQVDVLYHPQINEWQGTRSLQLVVEAIRPHTN